MYKRGLLILLAASLISATATIAAAQDQDKNNNSSNQAGPPPGEGRRHHGPMDPAQRTQMLTKQLKLTSDQQTKVQGIFETEQSQMEGLREDTTLSKQDMHTKMMDMHKSSDAQVRAILDPSQQKKWDEMQTRHEQWGEHRHGGEPGDQPGPPPQQ